MNPLQTLRETRVDILARHRAGFDPGALIQRTESRLRQIGCDAETAHQWGASMVWALCAAVQESALDPGERAIMVGALSQEGVWNVGLGLGTMLGLTSAYLAGGWLGAAIGLISGIITAALLCRKNRERAAALDDAALAERHRRWQEQTRETRWSVRLFSVSCVTGALGLAAIALLLYATNPDTAAFMAWRAKELRASSFIEALTPPDGRDFSLCSVYVVGRNTRGEKAYVGVLNHFYELNKTPAS